MSDAKNQRQTLLSLLGLCPLLPLSDSWQTGFILAIATWVIAVSTGIVAPLLRNQLTDWSRWPALVLLLAIATGLVEIGARAFAFESWRATAFFLPLLISNCLLLRSVDESSRQKTLRSALRDSLLNGSCMAILLMIVGTLRTGLPGDTLGATAFLIAGLLLAAKNYLTRDDTSQTHRDDNGEPPSPPRRVRVTGPLR